MKPLKEVRDTAANLDEYLGLGKVPGLDEVDEVIWKHLYVLYVRCKLPLLRAARKA